MKSYSKILLVATIAITGAFAHADVKSLQATRMTNLQLQADADRQQIIDIQSTLKNNHTKVIGGITMLAITSGVATTLQSLATGVESGKANSVVWVRAIGQGLERAAKVEGAVAFSTYGVLAAFLAYRQQELNLINNQISELQAEMQ